MRDRMQPASSSLEKIVADSLRKAPDAPLLAWPLACGRRVAERTKAVAWNEGVLVVEVPDAAWLHELRALAPRYVATVNRYVSDSVKRIEFVVAKG